MPIRENKRIVRGEELRRGILAGAEQTYDAVRATFGPMSGNVAIQKNWGLARITHDGVTVAREVYLEDSIENIGATILASGSAKTNESAGDGTSATAILGYTILRLAHKAIAADHNPMLIRRGIDRAAIDAKRVLDELKVDIQPHDQGIPKELLQVATISASGDAAIGAQIADLVGQVGNGVTIEEYNGLNIEAEIVEGYYFEQGYSAPQLSQVITAPSEDKAIRVLTVQNHLTKTEDIFPTLNVLHENGIKQLVIVGRLTGHALGVCVDVVMKGHMEILVVDSPINGQQRGQFLMDVATMSGGKLLTSLDDVKFTDLGKVMKATSNTKATTLIGGMGDEEQVQNRIDDIQKQLKTETVEVVRMHLENRLAKLRGKVGIIRVGGATPAEVKERKDRVDDAVHATQAAMAEGIVAGGATALLEVARRLSTKLGNTNQTPQVARIVLNEAELAAGETLTRYPSRGIIVVENPSDVTFVEQSTQTDMLADEQEGYRIVLEAFQQPFLCLMENSGQSAEYNLKATQKAGYGKGYHAELPTEEPINLFEAGVVDPVKVIKHEVENACSVAAQLATTQVGIVHIDLEKVEDIEEQDYS